MVFLAKKKVFAQIFLAHVVRASLGCYLADKGQLLCQAFYSQFCFKYLQLNCFSFVTKRCAIRLKMQCIFTTFY